MIVTIDGPAGSGKSTAARGLAQRLGFDFLDTGAMYRVVTLLCQEQGIDLQDEAAVEAVAKQVEIRFDDTRVFANGREVTRAIRTTEVTRGVTRVAANPRVRALLVDLQRKAAAGRNVVTEGRDQGTVVFPDAECKIFLTADPRQRAIRRQLDLRARGEEVSLETLLAEQAERDRRDEERAVGPLKPAEDAVHIDTSLLNAAETLDAIERVVRACTEEGGS